MISFEVFFLTREIWIVAGSLPPSAPCTLPSYRSLLSLCSLFSANPSLITLSLIPGVFLLLQKEPGFLFLLPDECHPSLLPSHFPAVLWLTICRCDFTPAQFTTVTQRHMQQSWRQASVVEILLHLCRKKFLFLTWARSQFDTLSPQSSADDLWPRNQLRLWEVVSLRWCLVLSRFYFFVWEQLVNNAHMCHIYNHHHHHSTFPVQSCWGYESHFLPRIHSLLSSANTPVTMTWWYLVFFLCFLLWVISLDWMFDVWFDIMSSV